MPESGLVIGGVGMKQLGFWVLATILTGCGQTMVRPANGYDAITIKQRVVLESVIDRYEVLAGTTLVGERLFEGRVYYCGLGMRNRSPSEVCLFLDGQDLVAYPGSIREIRATIPIEALERSKV